MKYQYKKSAFTTIDFVLFFIVFMSSLFLLPNKCLATTYTDGSTMFEYELNRTEAIITRYIGTSTNLVIPDHIGSIRVTGIKARAFENSNMVSVTIPKTITSIGGDAFYNCQYLSQINYNAINCADCNSWGGTFYNVGHNATSCKVIFGNEVKRVPKYLFYVNENYNYGDDNYAHLKTVVLSDSIQEIGASAFDNCYDLNNVTWGTGIVTIGDYAFSDCINMLEIMIPTATTSIGSNAFYDCQKVSNIEFNATNCADCNSWGGTFYNVGHNATSCSVTFGNGVIRVPKHLFYVNENYNYGDNNYAHLKKVVLSNSIQEIGTSAFDNCYDLSDVTWGTGIVTIGDYAFSDCINMLEIKIPSATTRIGSDAFRDCRNVSNIEFNAINCADCNSWGGTFYNVGHNATSCNVTFGNVVKRVPKYLFYVNEDYNYGDGFYSHIKEVSLPITSTEVESDSFNNCFDLKIVNVKNNATVFQENAFRNCMSSLTFKCHSGSTADVFAHKYGFGVSYTDNLETEPASQKQNTIPKAPASVKAKVKKNKVTLSWKKLSNKDLKKIKSIQVQYATNKKFTKNLITKKVKKDKTKYTMTLIKNKTYYVRVRYVAKNGVSKWSKVMKVKTKG